MNIASPVSSALIELLPSMRGKFGEWSQAGKNFLTLTDLDKEARRTLQSKMFCEEESFTACYCLANTSMWYFPVNTCYIFRALLFHKQDISYFNNDQGGESSN